MQNKDDTREKKDWLLRPIEPNEIRIFIESGENPDASPEFLSRLEKYMSELSTDLSKPREDEPQGLKCKIGHPTCTGFAAGACKLHVHCSVGWQKP